jgi:hypothetical protein
MSALHRFFKVVSYDKLNQTADMLLANSQDSANQIRKTGLTELMLALSSNDMNQIKEVVKRHQDELDKLTAIDKAILDFLNKSKE